MNIGIIQIACIAAYLSDALSNESKVLNCPMLRNYYQFN
jgi:hypothetical protein